MSRLWQTFIAPEEGPLPGCQEPWCFDGHVRIPCEHWELILDFAASIDPAAADSLRGYSLPAGAQCNPDPAELDQMVHFLDTLQAAILSGPRLSPFVTDEIPDDYEPEQHQAMLMAVQIILKEARRQGKAFRAFV